MTPKLRRLIKKVLEYNWDDEEQHYMECDADARRRHIFRVLRQLNKAIGSPFEDTNGK